MKLPLILPCSSSDIHNQMKKVAAKDRKVMTPSSFKSSIRLTLLGPGDSSASPLPIHSEAPVINILFAIFVKDKSFRTLGDI
jgi:hypothetical protein